MSLGRRRTAAMSEGDRTAALERFADLSPERRGWFVHVLFGMGLLGLSSPVELAVPVIRAVSGRRGVQTGPALGSLLTFLAVRAYLTAIFRQLESDTLTDEDADSDHWSYPLMSVLVVSGVAVLPAAGAVLPATVVLHKRSPLWGLGLWFVVRFLAATRLAVDASRLPRPSPDDAAPGPDATPPGAPPAGR